jgi:hypothetical protein
LTSRTAARIEPRRTGGGAICAGDEDGEDGEDMADSVRANDADATPEAAPSPE